MDNPFRVPTTSIMTPGVMLGRYRVLNTLGKGGMGVVLLAQDTVLDQPVCLKLLHDHYVDDEEAAKRFTREIVLARRVVHRGVCRVFDLHEHEGRRFLTMEFIEGTPLHKICKRDSEPVPVERAVRIVRNICQALHAAHEVGVIHRDLKPRNIMLRAPEAATEPDEISILDFGIATAVDAARDGLTRPGTAIGTSRFMAPEVWLGRKATVRSDVFAAGVILHHLLTTQHPWEEPEDGDLLDAMRKAPPTKASQQRAGIPRLVDDVLQQALAFRPEQRIPSALQLAKSCEAILQALASSTLIDDDEEDPLDAATIQLSVSDAEPPRVGRTTVAAAVVAPDRDDDNRDDDHREDGDGDDDDGDDGDDGDGDDGDDGGDDGGDDDGDDAGIDPVLAELARRSPNAIGHAHVAPHVPPAATGRGAALPSSPSSSSLAAAPSAAAAPATARPAHPVQHDDVTQVRSDPRLTRTPTPLSQPPLPAPAPAPAAPRPRTGAMRLDAAGALGDTAARVPMPVFGVPTAEEATHVGPAPAPPAPAAAPTTQPPRPRTGVIRLDDFAAAAPAPPAPSALLVDAAAHEEKTQVVPPPRQKTPRPAPRTGDVPASATRPLPAPAAATPAPALAAPAPTAASSSTPAPAPRFVVAVDAPAAANEPTRVVRPPMRPAAATPPLARRPTTRKPGHTDDDAD
jgi:serine/threonine protein kinase